MRGICIRKMPSLLKRLNLHGAGLRCVVVMTRSRYFCWKHTHKMSSRPADTTNGLGVDDYNFLMLPSWRVKCRLLLHSSIGGLLGGLD